MSTWMNGEDAAAYTGKTVAEIDQAAADSTIPAMYMSAGS